MAQITDAAVARLKIPPGKIIFDTQLPGFGVRGLSDGRKSWVVQKRLGSQHVRKVIGDVALMPVKEARAEAMVLLAAIAKGEDPRTAALRQPGTLRELCEAYLEAKESKLRSRSLVELRRYLLAPGYWSVLHRLQLVELHRRHITDQARKIAKERGGVTGNRAHTALSGALSWGVKEGWCEHNVASGSNLPFEGERSRSRVLSPDELAVIWRAAGDETLGQFGPITRLLVALPMRRNEIGELRAREVDLEARLIRLPAERTKQGKPHTVPLNALASEVLRELMVDGGDGDYVFAGERGAMGYSLWHQGKQRLDALLSTAGASIPSWTLHDLRRSCRTYLGKLRVARDIAESLLGHSYRGEVEETYDRHDYWSEKVEGLARWDGFLRAALRGQADAYVKSFEPKPASVTELRA
jgi:integrase